MRIVFMGTPDFAVPCLKALLEAHDVAAVVTQPDRPKGRGKNMAMSPVKELAVRHGLPVLQPERARDPQFAGTLKTLNAALCVVVAYGPILHETVLSIPARGCINVHGSLLLSWR